MRIAVTGATGFIGSNTLDKLLELGHSVNALSRRKTNPAIENLTWFEGDLVQSSDDRLSAFLDNCNVLIHCAGEISNEDNMHPLHVMGTQRLIDLSGPDLKHWIQVSSCGVYGPLRDGLIDETYKTNPVGAYEITKYKSEAMVWKAAKENGFSCNILRPSTVYSIDMPNNSLRSLIGAIKQSKFFFIGKPGAIYNFVHLDDVVNAITHCLHNKKSAHYNLSQSCTIEEFVSIVCTLLNRSLIKRRLPARAVKALIYIINPIVKTPLTPSRVEALTARTIYHGDKITQETQFSYETDFMNGLRELIHFPNETR